MAKYLLLLYNDPNGWKALSPDQVQQALQKFVAWRQKIVDQGIYLGSNKLSDDPGKVLRGFAQMRVTDGPYSETKEVLGGYFLIEAANYEDAVNKTKDCPGLEFGGTIEVREVDPMAPSA